MLCCIMDHVPEPPKYGQPTWFVNPPYPYSRSRGVLLLCKAVSAGRGGVCSRAVNGTSRNFTMPGEGPGVFYK